MLAEKLHRLGEIIEKLTKNRIDYKKIVNIITRYLIPCVYMEAPLSSSMEAQTIFQNKNNLHITKRGALPKGGRDQ